MSNFYCWNGMKEDVQEYASVLGEIWLNITVNNINHKITTIVRSCHHCQMYSKIKA
jgi:hypothetical protein